MNKKAISPVVKIIPLELEAVHNMRSPIPVLSESKNKSKRISESIVKKDNQEKATGSKNVPSDDFISPEICSHCNNDLKSQKDVYLEITVEKASIKVSNPNALVYVYESRGNEKYQLVGQSVFLRNKNNQLPMCRECSSSLTKLYKAFKHFSQLCHLESSISQQLKELQTLQTSISNQASLTKRLNDNSTLRNVSCSFANVKMENADTFSENDGDDFLNTDYHSDIPDYPDATDNTFEEDDIQNNFVSGNNSKLRLKNKRPKRNVKSTCYSDYVASSIDPEDESCSEFLPDSDDEVFKPKKSVKIKKRKIPHLKIESKINIKLEEGEQVEDSQDLAVSRTRKRKRKQFKPGESRTCPHCYKTFQDPSNLRRHIRVHTDEDNDKLTCTICLKKFTRPYHLSRHMIDIHKKSNPQKPVIKIKQVVQNAITRTCPVCSTEFSGKFAEFKEHIKTHNVERPYKCTLCSKSYAVPSRLKQHMGRTHKENSNEEFFCQVCHAKFGYSYLRLCHQRTHHSVPNNMSLESLQILESVGNKAHENNRFQCTMCEKAYTRKDRLSMHMLSHTTDAPFSCDICPRRFLQKRSLLRHKLLHDDQNPHTCKICSRSFSRSDHLKRHMETSHRPEKKEPVTCEVCGKQFKKPYQLKIHQFAHTKEKPWKCKVCGKEFNRASSVAYHQRVHSEERAYCCCTCGRTFKRAGHLRDHEALHLDLPKPYKCEVENCGKSFSRGTHLRKHLVIHSGEKSFACEICNAAFNRADNLRMHHRAVHLRDPTARRKQRPKNKTLTERSEIPAIQETEYKPYDYYDCYN